MSETMKNSSEEKREYIAPEAEVVHLGTFDVVMDSPVVDHTTPFGDKGGEGPTW